MSPCKVEYKINPQATSIKRMYTRTDIFVIYNKIIFFPPTLCNIPPPASNDWSVRYETLSTDWFKITHSRETVYEHQWVGRGRDFRNVGGKHYRANKSTSIWQILRMRIALLLPSVMKWVEDVFILLPFSMYISENTF